MSHAQTTLLRQALHRGLPQQEAHAEGHVVEILAGGACG